MVNFSPNRRSPQHGKYLEDLIPLHDVHIALAVDAPIRRAYLAADDTPLPLEHSDVRWHVTVPTVPISAVVVFECAA